LLGLERSCCRYAATRGERFLNLLADTVMSRARSFADVLPLRRSLLWNLPVRQLEDRYRLFAQFHCGNRFTRTRRCRFLEIGVWKASTLPHLIEALGNVFDYVGVDPYGQLEDDYYKGTFWYTPEDADSVYRETKAAFDRYGATLRRCTAATFFQANSEKLDVIFVDGDHRYPGCLSDCETSLDHIERGGLLIVDDYGNSFHPEVEWALREFVNRHSSRISRMGAHPLAFQLRGMIAPYHDEFRLLRDPMI
jgi:hypothetical protein